MDYEEEMAKIQKIGPTPDPEEMPSPEHMALVTAMGLDQAASQWAFKLFRDKKFRKLYGLEKLDQQEQDRIFNELVLAAEVVIMLMLEAPDLRVLPAQAGAEGMREYLMFVGEKIADAHDATLKEYGLEKKFRRMWKKLIKMRYEEYSEDKHKAREAAMIVEERESGEVTVEALNGIQLLLPVTSVSVGCHHHICRGKVKGKDEAYKYLVKSLGKFYVEVRVPLEGGKINLWSKMRVKARKWFGMRI